MTISIPLPGNWEKTTLENICEILDHKRIPINATERAERQKGKADNELFPYFGATGQVGVIDDYLFDGDYILVGEDGAPFLDPFKNKAYLVNGKFWVNNHAHILKACASRKYLHYYLNFVDYSEFVTGTTRLKLNQAKLKKIPILFPPLAEQKRIVAKIEELFSELDEGIASLNKAKEQLAIYRQSLLKHAFEGKLTKDWRKKDADKLETSEALLKHIKEEREKAFTAQIEKWKEDVANWEQADKPGKKPTKPKKLKNIDPISEEELKELPELPEGWFWNKLGNMTCGIEYGTSAKSKKSGKYPVLRMGNIQECQFDYDDLVYTSDDEEYEKYKLQKGDVLFNRTNSPELVGKTAIFKSDNAALFAGYLIRVNQLPAITNAFYLNYFLNSPIAKQYGNKVKSDGVNQSNINGAKLTNYPFPYCNIEEQKEIAQILVKKLTSSLNLEMDLNQKIVQTETLRRTILTNAFSGKLTIQGSAEEPASVLLERIKQEKANKPKPKRTRKTKTTPTSITMSDLKTVLTAINDWIPAQDAFRKCGIADDASTFEIEKLYEELKQQINAGSIERERRNDEDWLRLTSEG